MLNPEKKGVSLILNVQSRLCERNAFFFYILVLYKKPMFLCIEENCSQQINLI